MMGKNDDAASHYGPSGGGCKIPEHACQSPRRHNGVGVPVRLTQVFALPWLGDPSRQRPTIMPRRLVIARAKMGARCAGRPWPRRPQPPPTPQPQVGRRLQAERSQVQIRPDQVPSLVAQDEHPVVVCLDQNLHALPPAALRAERAPRGRLARAAIR